MKKLLLVGVILVAFSFSAKACAYYNFLSSESNAALEVLKEKFREKEIILEKEYGFVWRVFLPKNDGVETEEVQKAVYNDETGEFEAIYTFTYITILNAKGPTRVVWGFASKFHQYNVPRLCFVYESGGTDNGNGIVPPSSGTPSDLENWYWLPCGDLEGSGSWIQI